MINCELGCTVGKKGRGKKKKKRAKLNYVTMTGS